MILKMILEIIRKKKRNSIVNWFQNIIVEIRMWSKHKYTIIDYSQEGVIRNGRGYIENLERLIPNEIFALIKLEDSHNHPVEVKPDAGNMKYEIKKAWINNC